MSHLRNDNKDLPLVQCAICTKNIVDIPGFFSEITQIAPGQAYESNATLCMTCAMGMPSGATPQELGTWVALQRIEKTAKKPEDDMFIRQQGNWYKGGKLVRPELKGPDGQPAEMLQTYEAVALQDISMSWVAGDTIPVQPTPGGLASILDQLGAPIIEDAEYGVHYEWPRTPPAPPSNLPSLAIIDAAVPKAMTLVQKLTELKLLINVGGGQPDTQAIQDSFDEASALIQELHNSFLP